MALPSRLVNTLGYQSLQAVCKSIDLFLNNIDLAIME